MILLWEGNRADSVAANHANQHNQLRNEPAAGAGAEASRHTVSNSPCSTRRASHPRKPVSFYRGRRYPAGETARNGCDWPPFVPVISAGCRAGPGEHQAGENERRAQELTWPHPPSQTAATAIATIGVRLRTSPSGHCPSAAPRCAQRWQSQREQRRTGHQHPADRDRAPVGRDQRAGGQGGAARRQ